MNDLVPTVRDRTFEDSHTTIVESEPTREQRLLRWGVRAAQWRAVELAQSVFGPGVRSRLAGMTPRGAFRGLLHLDVEVRRMSLGDHRAREERFLATVQADPLLARHQFVFIFGALDEGPP